MTITTLEAPPSVQLIFGGQMPCDTAECKVIFGHPVDLDSEFTAPVRQQLQQVATAEHGWKQTTAGLFICSDCAGGPLGLVVVEQPHWNTPRKAEPRLPVMTGDNVSTVAIPAIRVTDLRDPAGRFPYSPKDAA